MSLLDAFLLDPAPFEIWIARRTDGIKGSGTASDPYDGSTAARFDERMGELPANTHVHLGPGSFETNGYADGVSGGWQPKAGMKIWGSGIGLTILKLVNATTAGKHYFAVGHALGTGSNPILPNRMDDFEIADLTIDANLAENAASVAVACGAVRVMGDHCRIQRVKAINWGTKSLITPCFVIAVITADPASNEMEVVDAGIADCLVVQPGSSVANGVVTLLHAGGTEAAPTALEGFGLAPFIRNCFIDCQPVPPGTPDLTYKYHGLSMGWCRGGAVEGNQVHNMMIGGPYQNITTTRDVVVRNNSYRNVVRGPFWELGAVYPTSPLTGTASWATNVLTVSISNHNLAPGDRVKLALGSPLATLSGTYRVASVSGGTFTVNTSTTGTGSATAALNKVFSTGRLLIEGNSIDLAPGTAGLFAIHVDDNGSGATAPTPDYVHGEVIIQNNKIRYVDGVLASGYTGSGVQANGVKNLIVRNNVVECVPVDPLRNQRCGAVSYFNDRRPAGVLVQGWNENTSRAYDELETDAEDAFLLGIIKRQ